MLVVVFLFPALLQAKSKAKHFTASLEDQYKWLVPLDGAEAVKWTKAQTVRTETTFGKGPLFNTFQEEIKTIVDSDSRVPFGWIEGEHYYNFWKDKSHPMGIWRRIPIKDALDKKWRKWDTLLDLDKLKKDEGKTWVFTNAHCLGPVLERCLVQLSLDGADLVETREFMISKKAFVADGFKAPLARTGAQWVNENEIFVSTDFGKGSLRPNGYPSQVRLWKRNTPLASAELVFSSETAEGVFLDDLTTNPTGLFLVRRYVAFRDREYYLFKEGKFSVKVNVPLDCELDAIRGDVGFFRLLNGWKSPVGQLASETVFTINLKEVRDTGKQTITVLFTPAKGQFINQVYVSKDHTWVVLFENSFGNLLRFSEANNKWSHVPVTLPGDGSVSNFITSQESNDVLLGFQSFLTPPGLYAVKAEQTEKLLEQKPTFDAKRMAFEQYWATSKDGTQVPYFVIHPKNMLLNGSNPTLLWGYGAGNVAFPPAYSSVAGKVWVERGGVFVESVLRGGGDRGPAWRYAGFKEKKQNTFDDFQAVAKDLIKRKITSSPKLGIFGASWGGLLVGASFVQQPTLFHAVVAEVPMLDLINFPLLGTGAGWTGELGDPKVPKQLKALKLYSPYHNVRANEEYPDVLFLTSTNDDRMHTAHARRMAAKMLDQGHNAYFWESPTGGHSLYTDNQSLAHVRALRYNFFAEKLGLTKAKE